MREVYALWRPTPLLRARRLEQALDTPAHIYYKYEGVSPAGSHKPNTAVAQAFYNKQAGIAKLATETGAGQWGSALALACQLFGLECEVCMVGVSYDQKPYRRAMIETWGGTVHRSPSDLTEAGRSQAEHASGSLGIAISEAVEVAASNEDTNYSLGSVLNHVCLHQTVIGQEAIAQLELAGEYPDVVVGCVGGGSNFAGVAFPFMREKLRDGPADALRRRRARRLPDPDQGRLPLRLRRHGRADAADADVHARPRLRAAAGARRRSALPRRLADGLRAGQGGPGRAGGDQPDERLRGRASRFARTEGIIPAPEPSHALRATFDEAEAAKEAGEERVILVNLCGHGHFDMSAYDAYLRGELDGPRVQRRRHGGRAGAAARRAGPGLALGSRRPARKAAEASSDSVPWYGMRKGKESPLDHYRGTEDTAATLEMLGK